jgi:class 3 adenylate cyclase
VLFTDIVDSTSHVRQLGDAGWLQLLERHNALSRGLVREFGGTDVRITGDGLLTVFPEPAAGIECARAMMSAVRDVGLELRAGLHYGPFSVSEGDVHGLAVHVAARIASVTDRGQVLVSDEMRARCGEITFESRGERSLKGLPGEWSLFAPVSSERVGQLRP